MKLRLSALGSERLRFWWGDVLGVQYALAEVDDRHVQQLNAFNVLDRLRHPFDVAATAGADDYPRHCMNFGVA